MDPVTWVSTLTSGISDFGPQLLTVAGVAIGVGLLRLGLARGWGMVKQFTK